MLNPSAMIVGLP